MLEKAPVNSDEGQRAIASEMAAYDQLSPKGRKAVYDADYNLFPTEVAQQGVAWAGWRYRFTIPPVAEETAMRYVCLVYADEA